MKTLFQMIPESAISGQAIMEILNCNEKTAEYHLALSPTEVKGLVEMRAEALRNFGRVEFGGGIIEKIITEFYDSPYISQYNYSDTIHELIEVFYYFKNETLDILSDDELLGWMKKYFDASCQGSLDLLNGRELERMAQEIRNGSFDPSAETGFVDTPGEEEDYFHELY
ncbi:MAG: DUF6323 family protein [Eubacteriales bacterium]|nr:DUF6323 family protein [Eubacteriales bacterium]MDD3349246.1 DUF6323 family protein [Eubacteriales bacterium]